MEIRCFPAEETDVAPILAQSRALLECYEDFKSLDREAVFAWMERKTRKRIGEYRRILCDGETAGWLRVCDHGDRLELDDLYVLPGFQNRGIGTTTLNKLLGESEKPVFLYVFTRNAGAIRLYERLGFRVRETVSENRAIMEREPCENRDPASQGRAANGT